MEQEQSFPFGLNNLVSWTIRRRGGQVTKFILRDETRTVQQITSGVTGTHTRPGITTSLSRLCEHSPAKVPVLFETDGLSLSVGDCAGARRDENAFDFVIDCGDVLDLKKAGPPLFSGDEKLVHALGSFDPPIKRTSRVLKIDWDDRKAPEVSPAFWPRLNSLLSGKVMTACMGGHGRSGTSFVCLLLINAPDYDALDAIIHLRALHCARAIESNIQHEYINEVAVHLGRNGNALLAHKINNYKAAFEASNKPTAIATRERLAKVEPTV